MGSSKSVEETKWKKKGRPSLLDLQKRNLRLQKLDNEKTDQNPLPNSSSLRSAPSSAGPLRRSARRNSDVAFSVAVDDEDEDMVDGSICSRKEKKLCLVLRPPNNRRDDLDSSGSDSDARRMRPIDAVGGDCKTERHDSSLKVMDQTEEPSENGPSTPLPDKKLLEFILDRLQKKDIYRVFSEPVDPDELPDYHEIIKHPMDFSTARKKLATGAYTNLEQFEKDVFLITSNAMRYNSSDTIYYRQARQIQELATKNFDNLRQESDGNEPEPKRPRRGRPPIKSIFKKIGRPSVELAGSDFSPSTILDKCSFEVTVRSYGIGSTEAPCWNGDLKSEKDEVYAGSLKGVAAKYGKKLSGVDESRRGTYNQSSSSSSTHELSVPTVEERKKLVPVGLLMQDAYARSLARFAANLGPIGWEIAAKRIERVVSTGTKFGHGWIGENDTFKIEQMAMPSKRERSAAEQHSNNSSVEVCVISNISSPVSSSVTPCGEIITGPESGLKPQIAGCVPKNPILTHSRALDLVSRAGNNYNHHAYASYSSMDKSKPATDPTLSSNSNQSQVSAHDSHGMCRVFSMNSKLGPVPPDLNVGLQSPGSSLSGLLADSQHSDLALQL